MLRRLLLGAIDRYQRRGGGVGVFRVQCNFEPSCSEYTRQAIVRFGVLRGLRFGLGRIRRCTDRDACQRIHDPLPTALT